MQRTRSKIVENIHAGPCIPTQAINHSLTWDVPTNTGNLNDTRNVSEFNRLALISVSVECITRCEQFMYDVYFGWLGPLVVFCYHRFRQFGVEKITYSRRVCTSNLSWCRYSIWCFVTERQLGPWRLHISHRILRSPCACPCKPGSVFFLWWHFTYTHFHI